MTLVICEQDFILLCVLQLIDTQLPERVREGVNCRQNSRREQPKDSFLVESLRSVYAPETLLTHIT